MWSVLHDALNVIIVAMLTGIVVLAGIAGYGLVFREVQMKYGRKTTIALSILGGIAFAAFIYGSGYVCMFHGPCPE